MWWHIFRCYFPHYLCAFYNCLELCSHVQGSAWWAIVFYDFPRYLCVILNLICLKLCFRVQGSVWWHVFFDYFPYYFPHYLCAVLNWFKIGFPCAGFCVMTYLSIAPEGLSGALLTGIPEFLKSHFAANLPCKITTDPTFWEVSTFTCKIFRCKFTMQKSLQSRHLEKLTPWHLWWEEKSTCFWQFSQVISLQIYHTKTQQSRIFENFPSSLPFERRRVLVPDNSQKFALWWFYLVFS